MFCYILLYFVHYNHNIIMDVTTNLMSMLEIKARQLKSEQNKTSCAKCNQRLSLKKTKLCGGCFKIFYCSADCQRGHWSDHKQACKILRPLRKKPQWGYNDRMQVSRFAMTTLYHHGQRYLTSSRPGTVVFCQYPLSKKDYVRTKLYQSCSSANWVQDPVGQCILHFFIIPLRSMESHTVSDVVGFDFGGFDPLFIQFCQNDKVYRHYVPVIKMKLKWPSDTVTKETETLDVLTSGQPEPEVTALSYFALSKAELA